jgi:hypothetical protein
MSSIWFCSAVWHNQSHGLQSSGVKSYNFMRCRYCWQHNKNLLCPFKTQCVINSEHGVEQLFHKPVVKTTSSLQILSGGTQFDICHAAEHLHKWCLKVQDVFWQLSVYSLRHISNAKGQRMACASGHVKDLVRWVWPWQVTWVPLWLRQPPTPLWFRGVGLNAEDTFQWNTFSWTTD